MKKTVLTLILIAFLLGCSSKDNVINSSTVASEVLVATGTDSPTVQLVDMADGTVKSNDYYLEKNGNKLDSYVSRMVKFRDNVFLIQPEAHKILVVDAVTFTRKAVFDLGFLGSPMDIAFPNATDAYVIANSSNSVMIYDLTTLKFATTIQLDGYPSAIGSYGNKVVIALDNGIVDIIGTNVRSVIGSCTVAPHPRFIGFTSDGSFAAVTSVGAGKTAGDDSEKSPAEVGFIDMATLDVTATLDLSVGFLNSTDMIPTGFVVSVSDWAFLTTTESLLRVDLRSKNTVALIINKSYSKPWYDPALGSLTMLSDTDNSYELATLEARVGKLQNQIKLQPNVTSYLIYR